MYFKYQYFVSKRSMVNSALNKHKFAIYQDYLFYKKIPVQGVLSTKYMQHASDTSNPIIQKYRKYLSDMSKSKLKNRETIFNTNFGSLRFDLDNDFEGQKKKSHLPLHNKNHSGKNDDTDSSLNYVDAIYFQDSLSEINTSGFKDKQVQKSNRTTTTLNEISDLNYIDSQYLTIPEVSSESEDNQCIPQQKENKECSKLDFIDSQYFDNNQSSNQPNTSLKDDLNDSKHKYENHSKASVFYDFENALLEEIDAPLNDNSVYCIPKTHLNHDRESLEGQLLDLSEQESSKQVKSNLRLNYIPKKDSVVKEPEDENEIKEEEKSTKEDSTTTKLNTSSEISPPPNTITTQSAYDYVKSKRKKEIIHNVTQTETTLPHEHYKKILLSLPKFSNFTNYEVAMLLKTSVIYNKNDIVALSKPYGMPVHSGPGESNRLNIVDLLPDLCKLMKVENLFPCHRLDMNTTGILLMAKTEEKANELKRMFKKRDIRKTYLAITKGIPNTLNGVIDIPIAEGKIGDHRRMVLRPDISGFRARPGQSKKAITKYKVLSSGHSCALLEVTPVTGVKHQVRVHLGFGIGCPILADHKYSFLTKMAPQKLPGDVVQGLGMTHSNARNLPLHLHAFVVRIPGAGKDGQEVYIKTGPPKAFKIAVKALKLSNRSNRHSNDYSDIIYGYE